MDNIFEVSEEKDINEEVEKQAQYWLLNNHFSNLEMTDNKEHKKWKYISDLMTEFVMELNNTTKP